MLTIPDQSLLTTFEQDEAQQPSPMKIIDKTLTIYDSRKFGLPKGSLWGQPVLCDFGEARVGLHHTGLIQPEVYRAPEVLFAMGWITSVDIWNVAVLVSPFEPCSSESLQATDIMLRFGIFSNKIIYSIIWTRMKSLMRPSTSPR